MPDGMPRTSTQTRFFRWQPRARTAILLPIKEVQANSTDRLHHNGREVIITWHPGLALIGGERVTQVCGLCFSIEGQLLLVSQDGEFWTLPGGRPEPGETHADTLTREVWEEACARVTEHQYLGAQRVADPSEAETYYQLRYLARVTPEPFAPAHEMRHRKLVDIDTARGLLWCGESRIAHYLLNRVAEAFR